jgi:hypothetical protein
MSVLFASVIAMKMGQASPVLFVSVIAMKMGIAVAVIPAKAGIHV